MDTWKDIAGYEGIYAVSDAGRVVRVAAAQSTKAGRQLQGMVNECGYELVALCRDGAAKRHRVHRLVALAFLGAPIGGHDEVNHKDGDKLNNCLSNLEWSSRSQNMTHAFQALRISRRRHADGKYA